MIRQRNEIISMILINMWPQTQGKHVMIKYYYNRGAKSAANKMSTYRLEACYLHWNDWCGIWLTGNVHNMRANVQKGLRSRYVRIFYVIPLVQWYQTKVMYCRTMNVFCFCKYNMVILRSICTVLNYLSY